jgi:hypothetical protein
VEALAGLPAAARAGGSSLADLQAALDARGAGRWRCSAIARSSACGCACTRRSGSTRSTARVAARRDPLRRGDRRSRISPRSSAARSKCPQPVRDRTHSARSGVEWGGRDFQLNLGYNASLYRDRLKSLTVEEPFTGSSPVERSRLALPPDNEWHNLHADLAANLPLRTRASRRVLVVDQPPETTSLPPTINSGAIGLHDLATGTRPLRCRRPTRTRASTTRCARSR